MPNKMNNKLFDYFPEFKGLKKLCVKFWSDY